MLIPHPPPPRPVPPTHTHTTTVPLSVSEYLASQEIHISVIIQYLSFCDRLVSLSIMASRVICAEEYVRASLLRLSNSPWYVYTTFCSSTHSSVDTWAGSTF